MKSIDDLMMQKCLDWVDGAEGKEIEIIYKEDDGDWHKRIYLVRTINYIPSEIWIIRVFTFDNGTKNINLSEDYHSSGLTNDLHVKELPTIIKTVAKVIKD